MMYQDTLKAVSDNPQVWAKDDRSAIFSACQDAWFATGQVHIAEVRKHLTRDVAPARIGANIHAFVRIHKLNVIGYAPNGDTKSGNGNKPSPIWARKDAA